MSNVPLVSKVQIIEKLRETCSELSPITEVSSLYPVDSEVVAYGVYVREVDYQSREPYRLSVQKCGSIYIATDAFEVLFVSYQDDPKSIPVEEAIQSLASNTVLFDGYHEVTFNQESTLGNSKSRRVTYSFQMKRLNFND